MTFVLMVTSVSAQDTIATTADTVPAASAPQVVAPPTIVAPSIIMVVARPLEAFNADETGTAAFIQELVAFRLGALNQIAVTAIDSLTLLVPENATLSKPAQRQTFTTAARQLHATHVLFPTIKINKNGKSVQVSLSLFSMAEAKNMASVEAGGSIESIADAVDTCVFRLIEKIALTPSKAAARFLKTPVSGATKDFRNLAKAIATSRESGFESQKPAEELKGIFDRDPQALLAAYLAAQAFGRARQYPAAAAVMEAMVYKLGPYYAALYPQTANYYRLADKLDDALKMVTIAGKMGFKTTALLLERAMILEATEEFDAADPVFADILTFDPTNPHAMVYLIKRYNAAQKPTEALELATRFKSIHAVDITVQVEMGKSLIKLNRPDEALIALRQAVDLDPANIPALMLLGDLYMRTSQCGQAIECFLKVAADKASRTADPYINAARCYNIQGLSLQALELLKPVESEYYGNTGIQREMGIAAFATGDKPTAKRFLNQYIQNGQPDTAVFLRLAQIYKEEGDIKNALKTLERAQVVAPDDGAIALQIAELSPRKAQMDLDPLVNNNRAKDNGSAVKITLGVGAGLIGLGAIVGGILFDSKIKAQSIEYANAQNKDLVSQLHAGIEQNQLYRTVLYTVGALGGVGCTVTFLIPGKKL